MWMGEEDNVIGGPVGSKTGLDSVAGLNGPSYVAGGGTVDMSVSAPMSITLSTGNITEGKHDLSVSDSTAGRKFDGGKLEYGLLPPLALEETVKVLTFGAQKYARDNWKYVDDSKRRYFDALQRHIWAWKRGEQIDPESGIHHLAHAMCCLMFLYEHDVKYSVDTIDKQ